MRIVLPGNSLHYDGVYGIKLGKSVFAGPPSDLENDAELRKVFL